MTETQKRERKYRKINHFVMPAYAVLASYALISGARHGDRYAILQAALGLTMLAVPFLLSLLPHLILPQDCCLLYYLFILCTVIIGSALYGYATIPYWDKIFHFLSGLLLTAAGLVLCQLFFYPLQGPQKRLRFLFLSFPFFFNLSAAALWEFYEYGLYAFLGVDAVNTLTTGVNDTMQDMLVCFLGGLLFLSSLHRYFRKGKRSFLLGVCFHFLAIYEKPLNL